MRMNRQLLPWALLLAVEMLAAPWLMEDQGYAKAPDAELRPWASPGISWAATIRSVSRAAFFGLGAYTSTLLLMRYGISPWLGGMPRRRARATLGAPFFQQGWLARHSRAPMAAG